MNNVFVTWLIMFIGMFVPVFFQVTIIKLLFNLESTTKERCVFALLTGILLASFKVFSPENISGLNPVLFTLLFVIFFYNYKKYSISKSFMYAFLLMFVSVPIEILSGIIVFKVLGLPNNTDDIIATIPVLLLIILWYVFIAMIVLFFKKKDQLNFQINNRLIGINVILVVSLFIPNIMFYAFDKYNYPLWLLCYNIIAYVALVIVAIYNTNKHIKLEITERNLQNSEMHNKSLNELVDSIRIFKHDYNNVVHAIGGYIATDDMDGLKKYYEGLSRDSKKVNQLESIAPDKINEPSVYGIFASKYQTAESKYIEFNFESIIDYQKLDMPIYDFCKILGVLLDNAIEAAEECEEKRINVDVRESKKTGVQLLSIENTYLNKDVDTEKIYEKNYSTKNRNSGLGLWEVKSIISRNKNVTLVTTKNDQYFKQELYIKSKPIS